MFLKRVMGFFVDMMCLIRFVVVVGVVEVMICGCCNWIFIVFKGWFVIIFVIFFIFLVKNLVFVVFVRNFG